MADPPLPETNLSLFMAEVGPIFQNPDLLRHALTHSSLIGSDSRHSESNERQEFLGDRVLGLIVADMLLARFPSEHEGDMEQMKYVFCTECVAELRSGANLCANNLVRDCCYHPHSQTTTSSGVA